ncbi:hypothetical protein Ciccas_003492 [Cichlidogyrus casuarinus]|uniref:Uncharacterized protein n=1 Tax=Cichlidogyrus casuarinus TaxID=1844966 RepID=A0ABD2QEY9_9PLAT
MSFGKHQIIFQNPLTEVLPEFEKAKHYPLLMARLEFSTNFSTFVLVDTDFPLPVYCTNRQEIFTSHVDETIFLLKNFQVFRCQLLDKVHMFATIDQFLVLSPASVQAALHPKVAIRLLTCLPRDFFPKDSKVFTITETYAKGITLRGTKIQQLWNNTAFTTDEIIGQTVTISHNNINNTMLSCYIQNPKPSAFSVSDGIRKLRIGNHFDTKESIAIQGFVAQIRCQLKENSAIGLILRLSESVQDYSSHLDLLLPISTIDILPYIAFMTSYFDTEKQQCRIVNVTEKCRISVQFLRLKVLENIMRFMVLDGTGSAFVNLSDEHPKNRIGCHYAETFESPLELTRRVLNMSPTLWQNVLNELKQMERARDGWQWGDEQNIVQNPLNDLFTDWLDSTMFLRNCHLQLNLISGNFHQSWTTKVTKLETEVVQFVCAPCNSYSLFDFVDSCWST